MKKAIYVLEEHRIAGMTEGNHSAPILRITEKEIEVDVSILNQKQHLVFYRDEQGNPAGPRKFAKVAPGQFVMCSDEDIDIF